MSEYISKESIVTLLEQYGYIDKEMERDLASIPSADVRPNIHARWEKPTGKIQPFGEDTRQCTGCGFFTDKDGSYVYNFCPNCGADMREPKGEKGKT